MSNAPVSSRVLEAAIAWKLNLDGGSDSPAERGEFMRWHATSEEHARAWRQLGAMDQRLSAAAGPARQALLQSRASLRASRRRRRMRKPISCARKNAMASACARSSVPRSASAP